MDMWYSKDLTFTEYSKEAEKTAFYPKIGEKLVYPTFGLIGESGELLEKVLNIVFKASKVSEGVKKVFRDKEGVLGKGDTILIAKELGDILWYMSELSKLLGYSLGKIAVMNLCKLKSREIRGTLKGNGDDR